MIYLIGSLRNPRIPELANELRTQGFEVFDDWFAAGEEADDKWRDYEKGRGRSYIEALSGFAANHVFDFDKFHLERATVVVLVLPAGRSGHLELGYAIGRGKVGFILHDDPERWDVMYRFATGVFTSAEDLIKELTCLNPCPPLVVENDGWSLNGLRDCIKSWGLPTSNPQR
jgi:hypothetical protein